MHRLTIGSSRPRPARWTGRLALLSILAAGLTTLALAPHARGQVLFESSLNCPSQIVPSVGVHSCKINYSNSDEIPVENVRFRVVWQTVRIDDLAPALEPDGVPELANPDYQDFESVLGLGQVTGPAPWLDYDTSVPANRVADFDVGPVEAQSSTQFEFNWVVSPAFPGTSFDVVLQTYLGDEEIGDPGRQVADRTYSVSWEGVDPSPYLIVQPVFEPDGRYMGSATVLYWQGPCNAQTHAVMTVELPIILDPSDIDFELGYRSTGHNKWTYRRVFRTSEAVPDDLDGVYRFPAEGEPNAGQLVSYDPATGLLTANIGIIYSGETHLAHWDTRHLNWRLRWNGAIDPEAVLDDSVQAEHCLTTATMTDPVCITQTSYVGEESGALGACPFRGCPQNPDGCQDELTGAFPPSGPVYQQAGETLFNFGNDTTSPRDVVVTVQVPNTSSAEYLDDDCGGGGSGICTDPAGTGRVARLTQARMAIDNYLGPGVAPVAGDAFRIQVSLAPADSAEDLATRVVPNPTAAWITCVELADPTLDDLDGIVCTAEMLADRGVAIDLVEEVRFVIENMAPTYNSIHDVAAHWPFRWYGGISWVLDDDVPASIDGASDQDSLAHMAFGSKLVLDLADFEEDPAENYMITRAGEVTRESFSQACGFSSVGDGYGAPCSGSFIEWPHEVFDTGTFGFGVANSGTIDNLATPVTLCTPIPRSFRLLDPDNPEIATRSTARYDDYSTTPVTAEFTAYTFDDGDPLTEYTYCVEITDWEGVPCAYDP
ncbi:MAG: hypothetical protein JW797_15455, partial [Bradymonadales bacterium]|nr:hypothetical protein [Bradymonadales bacterium]